LGGRWPAATPLGTNALPLGLCISCAGIEENGLRRRR